MRIVAWGDSLILNGMVQACLLVYIFLLERSSAGMLMRSVEMSAEVLTILVSVASSNLGKVIFLSWDRCVVVCDRKLWFV